ENYRRWLEAHVDREESRVIARLGITDASQADLEYGPTGMRDAGCGKREVLGQDSAVGKRNLLRQQAMSLDTHRELRIPHPASRIPSTRRPVAHPQPDSISSSNVSRSFDARHVRIPK